MQFSRFLHLGKSRREEILRFLPQCRFFKFLRILSEANVSIICIDQVDYFLLLRLPFYFPAGVALEYVAGMGR